MHLVRALMQRNDCEHTRSAGLGCYGKYLRASGAKKSPGGLSII